MLAVVNPTVHRVEVSGWDQDQIFFVENSQLEWTLGFGKRLTLARALPPGGVVFLRLVQPMSSERCRPVPYSTELLKTTGQGRREFLLHAIAPHPTK
jgi:hypothetical protein